MLFKLYFWIVKGVGSRRVNINSGKKINKYQFQKKKI